MSKSRTEIDKEIMYRKIMPSASKRDAKTAQADTGNSGAGQSDTALYDRVNGGEGAMGMPALSAPSAAAMAKTLKRSPVTFPFKEENNMVLVNLMEELVINKLDSTLDRFNCCKCDKCKKDIAALALNRLETAVCGDEGRRTGKAQEGGAGKWFRGNRGSGSGYPGCEKGTLALIGIGSYTLDGANYRKPIK